jgi:predicted ATPase
MPDTPDRARQELGLHVTLGVPLIATEGYAAPDAGSTYSRARELCRQLGGTPEMPQVLWGLWTFYVVKAALGTAREIAEEFSRVAGHGPYSGLTMEVTLIHLGEFGPAMEHCERSLSLYDHERHHDDAFRYSQNSAVAAQSHAAWALWFLGQPDQALDRMQKALTLAHELAEPHGLAHALFFSSILHQLRREKRLAQEHAEAALEIATEHRLLLYQATATVARSWAKVEPGKKEEVEEIRRGLAAHQATGTELLRPHFLGLLAEALHITGQNTEALLVLDGALAVADRNGERYYQAELYRLKGELLLTHSTPASRDAEECFHQSLKIAEQQKARSLELRAATSLARHYQQQARLTRICSTFTEGFDTSDMREAKALL